MVAADLGAELCSGTSPTDCFSAAAGAPSEGCSVRLADVNKAYQQYRGKGPDALKSRALYSRIIEYCRASGYTVTKDQRLFYGLELAEISPAQQRWVAGNV